MIESIHIKKAATYPDDKYEELNDLKQINFIYGANGSGKTTISRIVANEYEHNPAFDYTECTVKWVNDERLQTVVYNRDFVERNFANEEDCEIKGVFTLGEEHVVASKEIKRIKKEQEDIDVVMRKKEKALDHKNERLIAIEDEIEKTCWEKGADYRKRFHEVFKGFHRKELFKNEALKEYKKRGHFAINVSKEELEERAEIILDKLSGYEKSVPEIQIGDLLEYESSDVLKVPVLGKEDSNVAAMIKRLGNSDWVRRGYEYYKQNEDVCPFCQQKAVDGFEASLNSFFDESYNEGVREIGEFCENYIKVIESIQAQLDSLCDTNSKFLPFDEVTAKKEVFAAKALVNCQYVKDKVRNPSEGFELEPIGGLIEEVNLLVKTANVAVDKHNNLIENRSEQRKGLVLDVWGLVLADLKSDLIKYMSDKATLKKEVDDVESEIKELIKRKAKSQDDINALEKKAVSVKPAVDSINALLHTFGFQGFRLKQVGNKSLYKLVRSDDSAAMHTLSEGEKTFVTFLYFYCLLKGSQREVEVTTDRVVVFDDPVSSLDNDVLFVVGSLIKEFIASVKAEDTYVKQVFVLTHNVFFHKEVSYDSRRSKEARKSEETFWIVSKFDGVSRVKSYSYNPIRSSYELLWDEVRSEERSKITFRNTLRRILETYFKFLGGVELKDIPEKFTGNEKVVCNSLISWAHDGSHGTSFIGEDAFVAPDEGSVDQYFNVFELIFEKYDQKPHFEMMMNGGLNKRPQKSNVSDT